MSNTKRTALGIATAAGAACAAAMISMGTAYAIPDTVGALNDHDGFEDLFGAGSTATKLDASNFDANPANAAVFDKTVDIFQSSANAHPFTNLLFTLDPNLFTTATDPDIAGTIGPDAGTLGAGEYLVPDTFLGDVAVGLDYGLLNNTGLNFPLGALIDFLLGAPVIPVGGASDMVDLATVFG
jgi:hypothetical protein